MYKDRLAAGEVIAEELKQHNLTGVSVFAVPRGGIVVALPVARLYDTRLDVLVTRKIGHPANREFAVGAVMPDGSAVVDSDVVRSYRVSQEYIEEAVAEQYRELQRRMVLYTGKATLPQVEGKTVVVVDDGMATGYTIKAAVRWLKTKAPHKIIVAVPVAPPEVVRELEKEVDMIICPLMPEVFLSVGGFYEDFSQVSDDEVIKILSEFNKD